MTEKTYTVELTENEILLLLNDYADVSDYLQAEREVFAKMYAVIGRDQPEGNGMFREFVERLKDA